jgi:hypothetical protein
LKPVGQRGYITPHPDEVWDMSAVTITQMADRVSGLMEERMGVRGRSLADKYRKAGRRLPRKVRDAVSLLAEAAEMVQNPKLQVRVDEARVAQAYDLCVRHLGGIRRGERMKTAMVGVAASAAFAILVVVILVIAVVYWRGLV